MKDISQKSRHPRRKVFKNFAEYWHFIKVLSPAQRDILGEKLSREERRSLTASFFRGGWNDLMMRNQCDQIVDEIKIHTGVDLLDIRTQIFHGKQYLMQRAMWEHVNQAFDGIDWEHYAFVLDGIVAEDYDADYVKLTYTHE